MNDSELPPSSPSEQTRLEFERILNSESALEHHVLVLYVTGSTLRSAKAVANVRSLCEEYLKGYYELEVVDIYQIPTRLADDQIVAAPTLLRKSPLPVHRLVGNLADPERVIAGLNLKTRKDIKGIE